MYFNNFISPDILHGIPDVTSLLCEASVIIFMTFILWGTIQGMRRGFHRQKFHLAVTMVVALISFGLIYVLCGNVINLFSRITAVQVIGVAEMALASFGAEAPVEIFEVLKNVDMSVIGYLVAFILSAIVAPILFALVFILAIILGKAFSYLIGAFIPRGKRYISEVFGGLCGAAEGAIIVFALTLPIVGIFNISDSIVDVARENISEPKNAPYVEVIADAIDAYDEFVAPFANSAVIETVGSLGGDYLLDKLATVQVDGKKTDLRDEIPRILNFAFSVQKLSGISFDDGISRTEKENIISAIDRLDDSLIISNVAYEAAKVGAMSMDVLIPDASEGEFDISMLRDVAVDIIVNKTTPETLDDNLRTLVNTFFILADNGMFEGEDFIAVLMSSDENGVTVLSKMTSELEKNENTAHIVSALTQLIVDSMMPEDTKEVYEDVKESISEIVKIETEGKTEEEVAEEVKDVVVDMLEIFDVTVGEDENGITEEQIDTVVEFVAEELMNGNFDIPVDENGNISDEDLLDFLLEYMSKFNGGYETDSQGE